MSMKPYKATIEVVFAAPSESEANLLLGHMRRGATGALHPSNVPEALNGEIREMKQVPTGTLVHSLMDKIKREQEERDA